MRLGYHTNTWGGVVGHPAGVTSIKDLYYLANGSTEAAVHDIARAGYEGVELFDGNIIEYADTLPKLKQLLDEAGLALVATYSGANFIFDDVLEYELWRIERAARVAAELGAEHLVVGGGAQTLHAAGESEYRRLGAGLDEVVRLAERHGLQPSFHPHMGTMIESPEQIANALKHTSIGLCPDTGHVILGGGDPSELIRTHADRITYVHLKDVDPETGEFVPLGAGALQLETVMESIRAVGYDGWVTVELDAWSNPAAGAHTSREALTPWAPAPDGVF